MASVQFYDEFGLRAEEVYCESANWLLSAKLEALKLAILKVMPQKTFSVGLGLSESSRSSMVKRMVHGEDNTPHPDPLPQGERE